jgi:hypothetical protein
MLRAGVTVVSGRHGKDAVQGAGQAGEADDLSALLVTLPAIAEQATLICSLGLTAALHPENPA